MERRMEKEFTDSSTQTGTKVTGSTARDMARDSINGRMGRCTTETGQLTRCMATESSPPPTENPIKGNLRMMR